MGTSSFATEILNSLIKERYDIAAIFTQSDKKIGRKQELIIGPIKLIGTENGIPVLQPDKLSEKEIGEIKSIGPAAIIVASYGKILPKKILEIPKFGCLNIHASLLPKYRGASPIQNALLDGEKKTGNTIMLMDEGVDTGAILSQNEIDIKPDDTAKTLTGKLAVSGAKLLLKTLPDYVSGKIIPQKQNDSSATSCKLIKREDGLIDWNDPAEKIYNKYRAFQPWPGVYAFWETGNSPKRLKLINIKMQKENPAKKNIIGEVFRFNDDIAIQTGAGLIILKELQLEGKPPINAESFVNGHLNFIGGKLKQKNDVQ